MKCKTGITLIFGILFFVGRLALAKSPDMPVSGASIPAEAQVSAPEAKPSTPDTNSEKLAIELEQARKDIVEKEVIGEIQKGI